LQGKPDLPQSGIRLHRADRRGQDGEW
jgi:hypothetical protein